MQGDSAEVALDHALPTRRSMSVLRLAGFASVALMTAGCAARTFPLPMTASAFAHDGSGAALVAYLGQRDATPSVCDASASGPHIAHLDDDGRDAFVKGLVDGHVTPDKWSRCARSLLRSESKEDAASLLDSVGRSYRSLLKSSDLGKVPVLSDRLAAMQALYLDRANGTMGHPEALGPMFDDLRAALANHRLGPTATTFGTELLEAVDLERGMYEGHTVDVSMIDGLRESGDEKTLRLFMNRLPSPVLRDEAKRRVIRIHVAASPFPEVKADAARVEDTVMRLGHNPISIAEHPPANAWVDTSKMPIRDVVVRQHVWQQTATLLGQANGSTEVSVLPDLRLRGVLYVSAKDVSQGITVCGSTRELDPSPCVAAEDVALENPVLYRDKGSAFHFVDGVAMREAMELALNGARFEMPVSVGGRRLVTLALRLWYERPEDMIFSGPMPGTDGPPLGVVASEDETGRLLFAVSSPGGTYLAAVENTDAPRFRIASRGAQGATGESGSAGMDGSSGGECQNGTDGGPGGDGGPGSQGGNGGKVTVDILCRDAVCKDAVATLSEVVKSLAGPGGAGGAGGPGGAGGSGGPAGPDTVTTDADGNTTTTPGCSAGSSGSSGSPGSSGADGPDGFPGQVLLRFAQH